MKGGALVYTEKTYRPHYFQIGVETFLFPDKDLFLSRFVLRSNQVDLFG